MTQPTPEALVALLRDALVYLEPEGHNDEEAMEVLVTEIRSTIRRLEPAPDRFRTADIIVIRTGLSPVVEAGEASEMKAAAESQIMSELAAMSDLLETHGFSRIDQDVDLDIQGFDPLLETP